MTSKDKVHARLATHLNLLFNFQGSILASASWRISQTVILQPRAGGANETRTRDPLLAKQVLSQLSYSPILREALSSAMDGGPR